METYKLQNLKPGKTALILQRKSLISGILKQKDKIDNGQFKTYNPSRVFIKHLNRQQQRDFGIDLSLCIQRGYMAEIELHVKWTVP